VLLGVFRDANASQDMQRRMATAGLPAAIHQIQRYRAAFFIAAAVRGDGSSQLASMISDRASDAIIADMDCPGVAPAAAAN